MKTITLDEFINFLKINKSNKNSKFHILADFIDSDCSISIKETQLVIDYDCNEDLIIIPFDKNKTVEVSEDNSFYLKSESSEAEFYIYKEERVKL